MAKRMQHICIDFRNQRHMIVADLRELSHWITPGQALTVTINSQVVIEPEPIERRPVPILNFDE